MRAFLALMCSVPLLAHAGDRLSGVWHSDKQKSLDFAHAHTILEPSQFDFVGGMFGRLELTFVGSKMRYRMPDAEVSIQGKPQHYAGIDVTFDFRVLGTDEDSIAILISRFAGKDRIWHLHFVSDDLLWIYTEDGDYGSQDLNFREYFRKAKVSSNTSLERTREE